METRLKPGRTGRIDSLTGARFPAIMIIVFAHFEFLYQYGAFGQFFATYLRNGVLGADYFLALSGFGMMLSSLRKDPEGSAPIGGVRGCLRFARLHIRKTYPVYVVLLLCALPHTVLSSCLKHGMAPVKALLHSLAYFALDLTLLQSAAGISALSHSIVAAFWFMSCIFCIYIVSPLILRFLKRHVKTVRAALLGIALCIVIASLLDVLADWISQRTILDDLSHTSPYRRVFYVIPGMLLAQIYSMPKTREAKALSSGTLEHVSIVCSMIWFFFRNSAMETLGSGIFVIDMLLACGNVFGLALGKGVFSRFFSDRRMVYLGTISMYIYLTHYLFRMYIDAAVQALHLESLPVGILEAILMLTLTIAASMLIHRFGRRESNPRRL